jgi:hypothetical protein
MNLKPIETRYYGYCFRSRLEARWAVFLDTLGVAYEYEKEGYDLAVAGWYLPDFWLPVKECWIEVKGKDPTAQELDKVKGLALASKVPVWLFKGPPCYRADGDPSFICSDIDTAAFFFRELPDWYPETALHIPNQYGGIDRVRQAIAQQGIVFEYRGSPFDNTGEPELCPFAWSRDAYQRAFTAARSARFEHHA